MWGFLFVCLLLFILTCFTVTDWPHTLLSSFGEPTLEVDKETLLMLGVIRPQISHFSSDDRVCSHSTEKVSCILHIRASVAVNDYDFDIPQCGPETG